MKKKKTYILRTSKRFMKGHPMAGSLTYFKEQILAGEKIHTIRSNFEYWSNILSELLQGNAILSVREWEGVPYRSKCVEYMQLDRIYIESIYISANANQVMVWDKILDPKQICTLAHNDGLALLNFKEWFKEPLDGCIIHFTNYRYLPIIK